MPFFSILLSENFCTVSRLTEKGLRVHRLEDYVIKRDPQGSILKIIIKESINANALPAKIRSAILEGKDAEEYKDKDLEFVSPILNDLIQYPERRITKLEIQECNKLYRKYRS